jgi:dihydropteroate synthase
MAILNCTPDSFFDGGRYNTTDTAIQYGLQLLDQGADILDIGGQSTRPGASQIGIEEEWERIGKVIQGILSQNPKAWISVDTFHAEVARRALHCGAHIINDVSSGNLDRDMFSVVSAQKAAMVLMHMQGSPRTMQQAPRYGEVVSDVFLWLKNRMSEAIKSGVQNLIVDVGFGFGKTLEHNYDLLAGLASFQDLNVPVLAGISRKSMIWKATQGKPETALNGTTALHAWALDRGAHLLRVHDVKEAKETITLHRMMVREKEL